MRETLFIKKNKERWEELNVEVTSDPDLLTERYVQVLDDLAYAQTFYPRSKTKDYLNEKAVQFYNKIYSTRKEKISALFKFFTTDLPVSYPAKSQATILCSLLFPGFRFNRCYKCYERK
jgi:hypothetical protein